MSQDSAPLGWPTTEELKTFKNQTVKLKLKLGTQDENTQAELDFVAFTYRNALHLTLGLPPPQNTKALALAQRFQESAILVEGAINSLINEKLNEKLVVAALGYMRQGALDAYVAAREAMDLEAI